MSEWLVDHAFGPVPLWLIDSDVSDKAVRLYALLAGMRDYGTDMASVGRKLLAGKLRCSEDSVDRAKAELEECGALTVTRKKQRGLNVYTIHRADPGTRTGADSESEDGRTGAGIRKEDGRTGAGSESKDGRTGAGLYESEVLSEENQSTSSLFGDSRPADERARVKVAWVAAPGMIQHRDSYFASGKVTEALDKALGVYGADDVVAAIGSYAEVLASPKHFFNFRWTLVDFLKRGLDRFVPEAEPLKVFAKDRAAQKGRPQRSDGRPRTRYSTL